MKDIQKSLPWKRDIHTSIFAQCPIVVDNKGNTIAHITAGLLMEDAEKYADIIVDNANMLEEIKGIINSDKIAILSKVIRIKYVLNHVK